MLGPGRQEAGLFHLPVGPVAQDPVGLLPLPPLPTPRWISQPQTTSQSCKGKQREGPRQPPRSGQAQGPGPVEAALRAWEALTVDWTDLSSLQHRHMLQSLAAPQRPPPAPSRPQSGAPGGPLRAPPCSITILLSYPLGARPPLAVFQCSARKLKSAAHPRWASLPVPLPDIRVPPAGFPSFPDLIVSFCLQEFPPFLTHQAYIPWSLACALRVS